MIDQVWLCSSARDSFLMRTSCQESARVARNLDLPCRSRDSTSPVLFRFQCCGRLATFSARRFTLWLSSRRQFSVFAWKGQVPAPTASCVRHLQKLRGCLVWRSWMETGYVLFGNVASCERKDDSVAAGGKKCAMSFRDFVCFVLCSGQGGKLNNTRCFPMICCPAVEQVDSVFLSTISFVHFS